LSSSTLRIAGVPTCWSARLAMSRLSRKGISVSQARIASTSFCQPRFYTTAPEKGSRTNAVYGQRRSLVASFEVGADDRLWDRQDRRAPAPGEGARLGEQRPRQGERCRDASESEGACRCRH